MKNPVQSAYRPDIDGLRAIAILSVIVFHINKHLIPGGFVGVDIFFVISGFLISSHIMKDIERGRFSLAEFYRRRIKRLALPLLLVVLVTVLVAFLLMIQEDFIRTANAALYALLSLANVYFWLYQDTSYFAADSATLPLLHLWSLGVEEQFYIFWPLILILSYRKTRARAFFMFAGSLALASFAFGEFWFHRDFSFAYYMLPARAGELLAGAMVAMAVLRRVALPAGVAMPVALSGLLLLIASFLFLNENQVFPGVRVIMPAMGTALLILAGSGSGNVVTRLLGLKPLVWIGLVSYSAYLWHWPLLAFLRYEHVEVTLFSGSVVFCVTFWLAFLSYMLVELPAREWDATAMRIFLIQYVIPACLIAAVAIAGKYSMAEDSPEKPVNSASLDAPARMAPDVGEQAGKLDSAQLQRDVPPVANVNSALPVQMAADAKPDQIQPMSEIDTGLHDKPRPAYEFNYVCQPEHISAAEMKLDRCVLGAKSTQPPRVLLWGDSNAAHYVGVIGTIARQAGFNFRNIAVYSCPPLKNAPSAYVSAKRVEGCNSALPPILDSMHNADVVIVAAAWQDYVSQSEHFYDDFFATVRSVTADGKFVIIMSKVPVISSFDINCKEKAVNSVVPMDCAVKVPLAVEVERVNARLKAFAEHTPNVAYFDVTPYLCKGGMCSAYDAAGNALYFDTGHLSMPASWKIGESIVRQQGVPKPFARVRELLDKK